MYQFHSSITCNELMKSTNTPFFFFTLIVTIIVTAAADITRTMTNTTDTITGMGGLEETPVKLWSKKKYVYE